MKNSFIKLLSVAAAALTLSSTAQAALITGTIDFSGTATLNTNVLQNATHVIANGFSNVTVSNTEAGSSLAAVANGTAVTFTGAQYNFNGTGLPIANFWSVGGFSFQLTSSAVIVQLPGFLNVQGAGIMTGNGFEATTGTWFFTSQGVSQNPQFSFSSTNTTNAPDGGSTAVLAGLALVGLALAGRRFGVAKL